MDTKTWEGLVAFHLEQSGVVEAYAKNEGMDFTIPYQWNGADHDFHPDFLIRLVNGLNLILEVKGYEDDQERAKYTAAHKWTEAVTNWGQMGEWEFMVCKDPKVLKEDLIRIFIT